MIFHANPPIRLFSQRSHNTSEMRSFSSEEKVGSLELGTILLLITRHDTGRYRRPHLRITR